MISRAVVCVLLTLLCGCAHWNKPIAPRREPTFIEGCLEAFDPGCEVQP